VTERHEPNPYPRRKWIEYGALPAAVLFWTAVVLFAPGRHSETGSRGPRCSSYLKQLLYACQLYAGDCGEAFPPDLGALYSYYVTDASLYICPATRAPVEKCRSYRPGAVMDEHQSYCYVSGLTAADDPDSILIFDEEWNHEGKGALVASIDGQILWQKDIAAFHERLAKQKAELEAKGRTTEVIRPSWSTWPAKPQWPPQRSHFWWIVGGIGVGAVLLAAAATLVILLRRRRRRLAAAMANPH